MWNSPAINVVLRRLHLSAGLAIIALLAAWPTADLEQPWRQVGAATTWSASAGLAIVLALLAWISLADGRPAGGDLPHRGEVHSRACRPERGRGLPPIGLVRWASPLLPLLAVALAACSAAGVTARWIEAHPVLPALRGANLWMTIAVLVGAGLVLLCSLGRTEAAARQRANAPGILLLAAAAGSTLGAGVAEQASRLLQSWCPTEQECLTIGEHVDWLAVTLVMVLAAAVLAVVAWNLVRIYGRQADWRVAARNLTDRGSWINGLLGALGALATAAGVLWIVIRGGLPPTSVIPTQLAAAVVIVLLLPIVVAAVVRLRRLHPLAPILVVVVAAAVAGAVATGQSTQLLGIPLPPTSFREFALTVAVVLPTVAVLRKIYTGLRSQEIRRTTGVLWDVGTFWPRWFHPFAPPAYSDRAVTHLIERIETRADANEDVLLVAAHSQGSIIAGTAILDAAPSRPVALLTFGSPWRHLYTEFFPAYFGRAATCELAQRLPGRWRNLFRVTDPIGGPVGLPDVDATPMSDPSHRIHSNYWLESQYHDETRRLDAALPP
jgi:hypothetical protein